LLHDLSFICCNKQQIEANGVWVSSITDDNTDALFPVSKRNDIAQAVPSCQQQQQHDCSGQEPGSVA